MIDNFFTAMTYGAGAYLGFTLLHSMTHGIGFLGLGKDDSDGPKGARSGLIVARDHKTDKEYLVTFFGGITPRLPKE